MGNEDSVQVNYTHSNGGLFTWEVPASTMLDCAKRLHDEGHFVGSIAVYRYPAKKTRKTRAKQLAIWYSGPEKEYYGIYAPIRERNADGFFEG